MKFNKQVRCVGGAEAGSAPARRVCGASSCSRHRRRRSPTIPRSQPPALPTWRFAHPQARSEFGRTWAAPRGEVAATAPPVPAAAGGNGSGAATGQAVASFYGTLVQTSGRGWVSGGTLQDCEPAAPAAVQPAAAAVGATEPASAEPSHAGLGSAAAQAEQQAEAAALQYPAPAGPAPRGEQEVAIQPPAATWVQQEQQGQQGWRAPQEGVRYSIARTNVGFQLLKKAGWTEGSGLGAKEQGRAEPIATFQQKGNLGLGYAPKPSKPAKRDGAAAAAAGAGGAAAGAAGGGQQATVPKRPLPEDPLDKEDTEKKVKRVKQVGLELPGNRLAGRSDGACLQAAAAAECAAVAVAHCVAAARSAAAAAVSFTWLGTLALPACCSPLLPSHLPSAPPNLLPAQVMQAEADDKAGKAIARYMRMAFNDATGEATLDSNPLLRRNHKLRATNPLL